MKTSLVLYGATGYTGQLIAEMAHSMGVKLVLSGRNEFKLRELAARVNAPYRVASLDHPNQLDQLLHDAAVVIHAAGPFADTAQPMIEACLRNAAHYVDITGEIAAFELAKQYHRAAVAANIVILPGAGFDVVPTDCLALYLKNQLATATHLKIAFASTGGGLSHGTATTMIRGLGEGGMERRDGKLVQVPLGKYGATIKISNRSWFVMSIPWGDVSTAFHTTGIPNIRTYTKIAPMVYRVLKLQGLFNPLLRTQWVRQIIQSKIDRKEPGPGREMLERSKSYIWAEVSDGAHSVQATLTGPGGYTMTAFFSLEIARRLLNEEHSPGYHTPAGLFGEDLVLAMKGIERSLLS